MTYNASVCFDKNLDDLGLLTNKAQRRAFHNYLLEVTLTFGKVISYTHVEITDDLYLMFIFGPIEIYVANFNAWPFEPYFPEPRLDVYISVQEMFK